MSNLEKWDSIRKVPEEAKKTIGGGRLKGMTDINPMWRFKKLTELYGPVGIGWYYTIDKQWLETSMATDEIAAMCNITLYVKDGEEWSKGIQGTGGSMFLALEKNGLYTNDEAFKMALTDAISVACKAMGMGADVYWQADTTKYNDTKKANFTPSDKMPKARMDALVDYCDKHHIPVPEGIETWTNADADAFKAGLKEAK